MTSDPEPANPSPDPLPTRIRPHQVHPVDLPGSALIGGRPLRWTTTVIAVATLFLALTDAASLHGWAAELPPSLWGQRLEHATARWEALTESLGLGATRRAARERWTRAQAARFGEEAPRTSGTAP